MDVNYGNNQMVYSGLWLNHLAMENDPCVDGSIGYFMDVYGDLPSDADFPELLVRWGEDRFWVV